MSIGNFRSLLNPTWARGVLRTPSSILIGVATRIYSKNMPPMGCQIILLEVGNSLGHVPDPPVPFPEVQSGPPGIAIATRCPDDGDVDLEVWAGDPGPPSAGWEVVFDGSLDISARGLDAGPATAAAFYVDATPGKYRVRAEARRDRSGLVDGVRFIFPDNRDLQGEAIY